MLTFAFNISVILASFLFFILTYIVFRYDQRLRRIKQARKKDPSKIYDYYKQNIFFLFVNIYVVSVIVFVLKIMYYTGYGKSNIFYLQALVSLIYFIGIFINIRLILKNKLKDRFLWSIFLIAAFPLVVIWLKTNILDGFKPFMSNYLLVEMFWSVWIVTGLIPNLKVLKKYFKERKKTAFEQDDPVKIKMVSIAGLFTLYFIVQLISIMFTKNVFDYVYVFQLALSIPILFLIYTMIATPFISIEFYENPLLYFRQRIIVRMVFSLAILIIISLGLVNYATVFIVKQELESSKNFFFQGKLQKINLAIEKEYLNLHEQLNKLATDFVKTDSLYYIGLNVFNRFPEIETLDKLIMINAEGEPLMHVTRKTLNFAYGTKKEKVYERYMEGALAQKYYYKFNYNQRLLEISIPIYEKDGQLKAFIIAFFKPSKFFELLDSFRFDNNGEIQLYTEEYQLIYSTYDVASIKEEFKRGEYFEVDRKNAEIGFYIMVKQPYKDAFGGIQKAQYNSFFFTTLAIILFMLVSLLYIRIIESPMRKLKDGIELIGAGEVGHKINIREKNEFYELANAFNEMMENIKKLELEKLKQEQLESIMQMSVGLNHEINNPIATIIMGSQLSLKKINQLKKEIKDEYALKNIALLEDSANGILTEANRIAIILKNINNITDPVVEDYVDGTKMLKVKFD